ncbi:MAG: hypothetical protein NTV89_09870 [Proteobacteria bacterium]|nr:hypothetical protein [Pseudomonadota bacterium]
MCITSAGFMYEGLEESYTSSVFLWIILERWLLIKREIDAREGIFSEGKT